MKLLLPASLLLSLLSFTAALANPDPYALAEAEAYPEAEADIDEPVFLNARELRACEFFYLYIMYLVRFICT